jgi:integrase/recombinase XerD
MKNEGLDPLMEGYLEYLLHVGRRTPRTVTDIRCTLKGVVASISRLAPGRPLWKLELEPYLRWLDEQQSQGRSRSSLNKNLSHLRGFLEYAWRSGHGDRNVLDGFMLQDATSRQAPRALSVDEARRLIESSPAETAAQRRERVILLVLYGCGLRTQELCRTDVQDVDRQRWELMVRYGKGDLQRMVPIPEGVHAELLAYLMDRGGKRGPLFRTVYHRGRIAIREVCQVVRRASERAGIGWKVTPKTLRHSYATHLMDNGVDLAVIAALMGHRSPSETGVYLHVLQGRPESAVKGLELPKGGLSR